MHADLGPFLVLWLDEGALAQNDLGLANIITEQHRPGLAQQDAGRAARGRRILISADASIAERDSRRA